MIVGKSPQGVSARGFGLAGVVGEQFGTFAEEAGVAPGNLRTRVECGYQFRVGDVPGPR